MANLSEIRSSVNETARIVSRIYLAFLLVCLYLALSMAGIDDLLLLKKSPVNLPLVQIEVPIDLFFAVFPVIVLLLHFHLLLRLKRLFDVTNRLRIRIERLDDLEQRSDELSLLFPFEFLQAQLYTVDRDTSGKPPPIYRPLLFFAYDKRKYGNLAYLQILVSFPIYFVPTALLIWAQLIFLPYQSETITFIHQCTIFIDTLLQIVFIHNIEGFNKQKANPKIYLSPIDRYGHIFRMAYISMIWLILLVFSWMIAVVPDSGLERSFLRPNFMSILTQNTFDDWWQGNDCAKRYFRSPSYFKRYLLVQDKSISADEPNQVLMAAYVHKDDNPERSWELVEQLDLSNRSFRYGRFDNSDIRNTTFANSDLHCAQFSDAKLWNSVFDGTILQEPNDKEIN